MLLLREMKKVVCSISYVLFVAVAVFALYSQGALDFSGDKIEKPQPGGNYGTKNEEVPEIIMPAALKSLYQEFLENNYVTYPLGFYKNIRLDSEKQMEIANILSVITGEDGMQTGEGGMQTGEEEMQSDISYEEFQEQMQKVDDILGGGSDYAADSLVGFGTVPVTYEEALEGYELAKDYDKMTGGYARLFCDYAGVMVCAILPVFLAVLLSIRDRRAGMEALIYTRRIPGARIVLTRYGAIILSVMLAVVILAYLSNATVWKMYPDVSLDYLAPLKYVFGWLLPSVMVSAAVGMFLTELTNTPAAIAVQGLWWFLDINAGIKSEEAACSLFRLAPRHNAGANSYFRTGEFREHFGQLAANRLLFAGMSVVMLILTISIYEAKRKGKLHENKKTRSIFAGTGSCKNKLKA